MSALTSLAGAGFNTIVSTISANKNAKEQRRLTEAIARMNSEQQAMLEKRLQDAQSASERLSLVFQAVALEKNRDLVRETTRQKVGAYIVVGVGMASLAFVIFLARKK